MTPDTLLAHHDSGKPWPAQAGDGLTDVPAAYQVALAVRALREARGEIPCGFKVGFTNRGIWPRYNVFAPIWGTIWNTTLAFSDDDDSLSLARLCQPRIEPETVFCLKSVPRPGANLQDLFDALDWVAPGFELVQSHQPDWKFTAAQTVADSGLHGRLLVGPPTPVQQLAPDATQLQTMLAAARVGLHRNGVLVEEGVGANVLDSPLQALLHFLNELRACPGAPDLSPGDLVTTGTWTDAWPVHPGEHWMARFDSALPPIEVTFR